MFSLFLLIFISCPKWSLGNDNTFTQNRMFAAGSSYGGLAPLSSSRIHYELYKALAGETVRLECPQANPTWFFRKATSPIGQQEDLIVTRHGIINVDYKYKIVVHMNLKHKVIIINSVEYDDEGLYTCLYTMPTSGPVLDEELGQMANSVQYRHVFNVSIYSMYLFCFNCYIVTSNLIILIY